MPNLILSTTDRAEWLRERRNGIGGSDIVRIQTNPFAVWVEKLDLDPSRIDEESDAMWLGNVLEGAILDWLTSEHLADIPRDDGRYIYAHERNDFARFSPDGRGSTLGGSNCLVECKWVWYKRDNWKEGIPDYVQDQCQWGMYVLDLPKTLVGAVLGGKRTYGWVERDEKRIAELLQIATDFWTLVQTHTAPPIDGSEETTDILCRINSEVIPPPIMLSSDLWQLDQEYVDVCEKLKTLEERRNLIRNRVLQEMGNADRGELPDAMWVRSPVKESKFVVEKKAGVQLRRKARKP